MKDLQPPDKYWDNDISLDRWVEQEKFREKNTTTNSPHHQGDVFEVID